MGIFFKGKDRFGIPENDNGETVVLLHGLFTGAYIMAPLARHLRKCGYRTAAYDYPTVTQELPPLGEGLAAFLNAERFNTAAKIHFVTHSMGGLLFRAAVNDISPERRKQIGRVVMIAPPNKGSDMAALAVKAVPGARHIVAAIHNLSSAPDSFANTFPEPPHSCEIGVIAASCDWEVRRPYTHLTHEWAHIVLKGTHTGILFSAEAAEQTRCFIQNGKFKEGRAS